MNGFEFKLEKRSFIKIFKEIILLDEQKLKNIKKQARKTILDVVEKNKVFEINFKNMFFSNLRSN